MLWQSILGIMVISSFPLLSKAHTQYWFGGADFCMVPGLQVHITPLPVFTPRHSPASHFYGSEGPRHDFFLPTLFLTHQEITSFYSYFSTELKTQALSKPPSLK